MKSYRFITNLILILVMMVLFTTISLAQNPQPQTTQYLYDNNGRLSIVIYPDGSKTLYTYDPAGNITNINTIGTQPGITSFSPDTGTAGDSVTINGLFGNDPVTVAFNSVTAQQTSATNLQIVAIVPATATTGPITVTNQFGAATTTTNFTIVAKLVVMPIGAQVQLNTTQQFTAMFLSYTGDTNVTWSVNGIMGGNSDIGTIDATGLYTAPAMNPGSNVIIRATSVANPTLFGEVTVIVTGGIFN